MRDNNGKIMPGEFSTPELEYLAGNRWGFSEKVDGTNIRVIFEKCKFTYPADHEAIVFRYAGRGDNSSIPQNLLYELDNIFTPDLREKIITQFPDGVTFYGEGYGPRIQKVGKLYRADQSFVLFDIKVGPWWLTRTNVEGIALDLGLEIVPIIGEGTLLDSVEFVKDGFNSTWGDFEAEGIVARPVVELFDRSSHRIITKIKCKDFR